MLIRKDCHASIANMTITFNLYKYPVLHNEQFYFSFYPIPVWFNKWYRVAKIIIWNSFCSYGFKCLWNASMILCLLFDCTVCMNFFLFRHLVTYAVIETQPSQYTIYQMGLFLVHCLSCGIDIKTFPDSFVHEKTSRIFVKLCFLSFLYPCTWKLLGGGCILF